MRDNKKQNTLLIIRLSALGDVAMTLPAVQAVALQYPTWRIRVLTRAAFAPIFSHTPQNVSVLGIDPSQYRGVKGFFRLLRLVQAEHPTRVADFHNVLRSWLIDAWFFCTGHRVAMLDKQRRDRAAIIRKKQSVEETRPYVLRYFDVLERLGMPAPLPTQPLVQLADTPRWLAEYLPHDSRIPIGIAPFARYRNKTYPVEKMQQLIELLQADGRFCVYLFGGRSGVEAETMQQWRTQFTTIAPPQPSLTLEQEILLMSRLRLMVSMDSANMHLASLGGTTVVSVWGSTTPACGFMGWQQQAENAVQLSLPCQPCTTAGSPTCPRGDFACLVQLAPETLYRAILRVIDSR